MADDDDDKLYVATPKGVELALFVVRWWVILVMAALALACLSGIALGWWMRGG